MSAIMKFDMHIYCGFSYKILYEIFSLNQQLKDNIDRVVIVVCV
jgi:hypothetical protein